MLTCVQQDGRDAGRGSPPQSFGTLPDFISERTSLAPVAIAAAALVEECLALGGVKLVDVQHAAVSQQHLVLRCLPP